MLACMSPAHAENLIEKIVGGYTDLSVFKGEELKACATVLSTFLVHKPKKPDGSVCRDCLKEVTQAMQECGCFDAHSMLASADDRAVASSQTQTQTLTQTQEIRVAFIDRTLLISIPSLDEDVVGTYVGRQIEAQILRLPAGWREKVAYVILDLTKNGGGMLRNFIDIMEVFSPGPGIEYGVLPFKNTALLPGFRERVQITKGRGMLADIPIILVVSNQTASFTELLVMTIRHEWYPKKSEVVGASKTWGKTESQCWRTIDGAVSLKVTCASWQVAGIDVHGVGIEPDRYVDVIGCDDLRCVLGRVHAIQAEAKPR